MSEKLIVSWEEYTNTVEKLAVQIDNSGYKCTILIGIMRGAGLCIDLLSRIWKMKTGYLSVQSYSGKGIEDTQGTIMFSRQISSIAEGNDFEKILLIDDLSDTGLTLNKSIEWLKNHEPIKDFIKEIKTGCLWRKKKSTFAPDFCAVNLPNSPWIVQPFEKHEEVRIEDLKKKYPK